MTGEWGILKRKRENVWGQTFSRVSGREIEMISDTSAGESIV